MTEEIKNRRPIRTRDTRWAKAAAMWLQRKKITPNDISLFSIICACIAGIAFLLAFYYEHNILSMLFFLLAIIGMQSRLICNLLDGMVAIEGGQKSPVGPIYNELPDRISDIIIFLGLGYGLWMFSWAAYLGWAAALFSVMTAYVRLLGGSCGLEQQFLGPFAKQQRMAILTLGCAIAIIVPSYGCWILYICLWIVTIGSLFTTIWRLYHILLGLIPPSDNHHQNEKQGEYHEGSHREDFPRISIDKL